ncbi:hypothetical protein RBSWK_03023 [Rhodopirellula baltica SWK14]|uniref:Uncharacterized protein n=1 Tax=Rhodopirellula baltica SWK14 TaxID=993516 RepID=L7CHR9_RHOBT|nr:hypothetical protein RBSWK_03023 [Rhodopirellula baltica SWK14]
MVRPARFRAETEPIAFLCNNIKSEDVAVFAALLALHSVSDHSTL